jgi:hypothetical protein
VSSQLRLRYALALNAFDFAQQSGLGARWLDTRAQRGVDGKQVWVERQLETRRDARGELAVDHRAVQARAAA